MVSFAHTVACKIRSSHTCNEIIVDPKDLTFYTHAQNYSGTTIAQAFPVEAHGYGSVTVIREH